MLRELEQRLVTVLGAELPEPLTGRVRARPDTATGAGAFAQLAVRGLRPVTPDFGAIRPEVAPGATAPRRIMRLEAAIDIRVGEGTGGNRDSRLQALDQLLYFLDAPEMRSGNALRDTGDPGFLLESLTLADADYATDLTDPEPADITLTAIGWFWPVGEAGEDGPAIAEARISQLVYPVTNSPDPARFIAGSDETEIVVTFSAAQTLSLRADGPGEIDALRVAFQLRAADGSAGAGVLTNGRNLGNGDRARPLNDGVARGRYQPPETPGTDRLIVRSVIRESGGGDRLGPVLTEIELITEASA